MAARRNAPRVYAESCVFFNVIKHEAGFWPESTKLLLAAERGDVQLVVSTLVLVEVSGWKGDMDAGRQDEVIRRYLLQDFVEWAELDLYVSNDVATLARNYHLRGGDAAHLQTAIRRRASYFMSTDRRFPYGKTVQGVKVMKPAQVWDMTTEDAQVDSMALAEEEAQRAASKQKTAESTKVADGQDHAARLGAAKPTVRRRPVSAASSSPPVNETRARPPSVQEP